MSINSIIKQTEYQNDTRNQTVPVPVTPDLLHNIYLGLFKNLIEWVEGFLKKHKRQQAFDDAWKELPPCPGFLVPKKAYREVTQ